MNKNVITKNGAKVITERGEDLYRISANNADVTVVGDSIAVLAGENCQAVITGDGGSVFSEGCNNQIIVNATNGIVKNDGESTIVRIGKGASNCKVLSKGDFADIEIDGENATFYSNGRKSKVKLSGDYAQAYICSDEEDLKLNVSGDCSKLNIEGKRVKLTAQGQNVNAEISGENYVVHQNASKGEYCLKSYGRMYVRGCDNYISLDSGATGSQINIFNGINKVQIGCDAVQLTAYGMGNDVSISGNRNCTSVSGDCSKIFTVGDGNIIVCSGNNQRIVVCGKNRLSVEGEYSTVYWDGDGDIIFYQEGSWLTLFEWKVQDCKHPAIPIARNYYIDGVEIKTGVLYYVEDGKLIETNKKNIND